MGLEHGGGRGSPQMLSSEAGGRHTWQREQLCRSLRALELGAGRSWR